VHFLPALALLESAAETYRTIGADLEQKGEMSATTICGSRPMPGSRD
jgi:hypothetical protein